MALDTAIPQPPPHDGTSDITALVISDLERRAQAGERKYGTRLRAFNGRNTLIDAYQEALDLAVYLRQAIEEQRSPAEGIEQRHSSYFTIDPDGTVRIE